MTTDTRWAYACLVAGGVLIIVGGLGSAMMIGTWSGMMGVGMMGAYGNYMTQTWFSGMAWWMGVIGLVAGSAVLLAAYLLARHRADAKTVATLAIAGGAVSLLAMGGWLIGAVLALVGGFVTLLEEPGQTQAPRGV